MGKKWTGRGVLIFLLAIGLLCTACSRQEIASVMQLVKTEGTVGISDKDGEKVPLNENMKLYSGYDLKTEKESFAWINLDSVKLAKMDAASEVEIQKKGKELELLVTSGNLFFNITEPLDDDETMDIRNSSMTVGIRGTCGWVEVMDEKHMNVYILEGKVECSIEEASGGKTAADVSSWEMAKMVLAEDGKGIISVEEFTESDIPDFVRAELDEDDFPDMTAKTEEGKNSDRNRTVDIDVYLGNYVCDENGANLEFSEIGRIAEAPGSDENDVSIDRGEEVICQAVIVRPLSAEEIEKEGYTGIPEEERPWKIGSVLDMRIRNGVGYPMSEGERWTVTLTDGQLVVEGVGDGYDGIYHRR